MNNFVLGTLHVEFSFYTMRVIHSECSSVWQPHGQYLEEHMFRGFVKRRLLRVVLEVGD